MNEWRGGRTAVGRCCWPFSLLLQVFMYLREMVGCTTYTSRARIVQLESSSFFYLHGFSSSSRKDTMKEKRELPATFYRWIAVVLPVESLVRSVFIFSLWILLIPTAQYLRFRAKYR